MLPLLLSVSFEWNHDLHAGSNSTGYDLVSIIAPVSQQCSGSDPLYQVHSFFAISSGTLCNKYSDRQTICIPGKVNLGVEPPFVRLMS